MPQLRHLAALAFVLIAALATPSCKSIDAATVPAQVVATTVNRGVELSFIEAAWPVDEDTLIDALQSDLGAWTYLDSSTSFATPAALKTVLQSQMIAVKVAIQKIQAGEYTDEQKLVLVQNLRRAWDGLHSYYRPDETPE